MKESNPETEAIKTLQSIDGLGKAEPGFNVYEKLRSKLDKPKNEVSIRFIQIAAIFILIMNFSIFGFNYISLDTQDELEDLSTEYFENQMNITSLEIINE